MLAEIVEACFAGTWAQHEGHKCKDYRKAERHDKVAECLWQKNGTFPSQRAVPEF